MENQTQKNLAQDTPILTETDSRENCSTSKTQNVNIVDELAGKALTFIDKNSLNYDKNSNEALLKAMSELWDVVTAENQQMKQEFQSASEALENDPRLAVLFNELMRSTPIRVALVRAGIFDFTPENGDFDHEEYIQALQEHRAKVNDSLTRRIRHEKNCSHTKNEIDKFYAEKGVDDIIADAFSDYVEQMFDNFIEGFIECDTLERLWKGFTYDDKINEAREAGKLEGVNSQINKKQNKYINDGLPLGGTTTSSQQPARSGYIERILKGDFI